MFCKISLFISLYLISSSSSKLLLSEDLSSQIPSRILDLYERRDRGLLGNDSDAFKTMEQLAEENGFKSEKHSVTTEDGYILEAWRIPGALGEEEEREEGGKKPPILLMHGIDADMMQWVYNAPEIAPAFILARGGYDVWMGNNRGNRWSNQHVKLDNSSKEYWDGVEWENMGTKDVPSLIDYILNLTNETSISYIGHSEGTS